MRFSAECCESFARTDVRGKKIAKANERKARAPNEMLEIVYRKFFIIYVCTNFLM